MRVLIAAASAIFLMVVPCAAQDDWTPFQFIETADDFTDAPRYIVGSAERTAISPAMIVLVCNPGNETIRLDAGQVIVRNAGQVVYRFDDEPAQTVTMGMHEHRVAVTNTRSTVDDFRRGLAAGSRLRFRVGDGDIHDVPLAGSTAAMRDYEDACEFIR